MKQQVKSTVKRLLYVAFAPVRMLTRKTVPAKERAAGEKVILPNKDLLGHVRALIQEGHTVTIQVKGYSMRPFLEHLRDQVVLGPFERLQVGDVVLAEIAPGVYVLHRIIEMRHEGVLVLMGDGNLSGQEICRMENVAGIVKVFIRNGRQIAADDATWVRYGRLWRKLLPMRRLLLLFYKMNLDIVVR